MYIAKYMYKEPIQEPDKHGLQIPSTVIAHAFSRLICPPEYALGIEWIWCQIKHGTDIHASPCQI